MTVRNSGNSPAKNLQISYLARIGYEGSPAFRTQTDFLPKVGPHMALGRDIAAGESMPLNHIFTDMPLSQQEADGAVKGSELVNFDATVRITFTDIFENEIIEEHRRIALFQGTRHSPFLHFPELRTALAEELANYQATQERDDY